MTPELSVLICSLNVRDHVLRCLESLHGQDQGLTFEVILVDNDSNDDTVEAVRARYPQTRIVVNRANVGFSRANNQALERARGELVLYLNPDTEVGPATLHRCAEELRRDPGLGMVGCMLLYSDGAIQYECARRAYRFGDVIIETPWLHKFFPEHPLFGRKLIGDWDHRDSRDVEAISGAFMMMPRALAQELGGLSEEIFLYHEDQDICLRVRQAGYRIRYLADVWTIHYSNRSTIGKWADPNWALLEVETKHRLVQQGQGAIAGAAARAIFGARAVARLGMSLVAPVVPGTRGIRERYPTIFNAPKHALQILWAVSPGLVRGRMPSAPDPATVPAPIVIEPSGPPVA